MWLKCVGERKVESRETKLILGMFILDTSLDAPRWDQVTLQVTLRSGACSGDVRDDQHYRGCSWTFAFRLYFRAYPGLYRYFTAIQLRAQKGRRSHSRETTRVGSDNDPCTYVSFFVPLSAINTPATVSCQWCRYCVDTPGRSNHFLFCRTGAL